MNNHGTNASKKLADLYHSWAKFPAIGLVALATALMGLPPVSPATAQVRTPASDDEVIERLPKTLSLNRDRMAAIRKRLAAAPDNSDLAAAAAQGYLRMGNEEGDPRFYGYARSAIEPWWDSESPPAAIARLRAKLKEKDHEYRAAIVDLEALLQREPRDSQAWVEVINLYRVTGQYANARDSLESLRSFADETTMLVASTPLLVATGQAERAYQVLSTQLKNSAGDQIEQAELKPWIAGTQAGIAAMLGKVQIADTHFRNALSLSPNSIHLKRTYAEFLLDYGMADAVLPLLQPHENDNGSLLLMAIAAKQLKQNQLTDRLKDKLVTRFDEIRLRGSRPHGRFESRYELALNGNAGRALEVALENWQLQKEVRDSRAVLEAAIAAGRPAAAAPVVAFLRASSSEDAAVAELIKKLELL